MFYRLFLSMLSLFALNTADLRAADPPWTLHGNGYLVITQSTTTDNLADAAIPEALVDSYVNDINIMMLVDYTESPVGPYGELLYMPGNFRFADGRRHFSITKIFVDSPQSLADGRRNWGIPKELADFHFSDADGETYVEVGDGDGVFAEMRFTPFGPYFPVNTFWIAPIFRTLGQVLDNTTFVFTLAGEGRARFVHFDPIFFDPARFPDMQTRKVIAAVRVENFTLTFPVADIIADDAP